MPDTTRLLDLVIGVAAHSTALPCSSERSSADRHSFGNNVPTCRGYTFGVVKCCTMPYPVDAWSAASRRRADDAPRRVPALHEPRRTAFTGRGDPPTGASGRAAVTPRPLPQPLHPQQARRHEARLGLGGLAQVQRCHATTWERRLALDVGDVDTQNLRLDPEIRSASTTRARSR